MWDERVNILIVDDHRENLVALNAILLELGQNVVSVESGRDALKQVLSTEFALILLDVEMPFMDGFETARLIRQRESSRHTPIIFLTAVNKSNRHVFEGYSIGAVDYLLKPFDPDILRSKVIAFVDLFRKNKEIIQQTLLLEQTNRELQIERDFASAVLDRAGSIVIVIDSARRIVKCNRAFERILGYSFDEVIGKELAGFFARGYLHETDTKTTENLWLAKDGSTRLIAWSQAPLMSLHGLDCLIITGNDMTQRKRAEEERAQFIREQAARAEAEAAQLRSAFLSEAAAMLVSSIDYETTVSNITSLAIPQFADWCFVFQSDGEGCIVRAQVSHCTTEKAAHLREIIHAGTSIDDSCEPLRQAFRSGKAVLLSTISADELRHMIPDQTNRNLVEEAGCASAVIVPIPASAGVVGIIGFVSASSGFYRETERQLAEDLARRMGLALENAQLYRSAQQANRAKDEFLATLSHELRTPLNAILGWIHIMQRRQAPDVAEKGIEAIERNARIQARLIEDMLDVSRIITGKLRLDLQPVDVVVPIESALESLRPAAEAKGIHLVTSVAPHDFVLADSNRVQQVVWNLLSNAIKFTPNGGAVSLESTQVDSDVCIFVRDTGKGISKHFLPFVFDRFRQAETASNRHYGGLGLGLSIARHLVELHGGTIHAESEGDGKGACFTVSFPVRQHYHAARQLIDDRVRIEP